MSNKVLLYNVGLYLGRTGHEMFKSRVVRKESNVGKSNQNVHSRYGVDGWGHEAATRRARGVKHEVGKM